MIQQLWLFWLASIIGAVIAGLFDVRGEALVETVLSEEGGVT